MAPGLNVTNGVAWHGRSLVSGLFALISWLERRRAIGAEGTKQTPKIGAWNAPYMPWRTISQRGAQNRHQRLPPKTGMSTKQKSQTPCRYLAFIIFHWSGRGDSNARPPAPKAGALTRLRYAPTFVLVLQRATFYPIQHALARNFPADCRETDRTSRLIPTLAPTWLAV